MYAVSYITNNKARKLRAYCCIISDAPSREDAISFFQSIARMQGIRAYVMDAEKTNNAIFSLQYEKLSSIA